MEGENCRRAEEGPGEKKVADILFCDGGETVGRGG